jgi:hypothetical protein
MFGSLPSRAAPWDLPDSCSGGHWGEECLHGGGVVDTVAQDKDQWMEITTDSPTPLAVRYRLSRTPDDWNCDQAQGNQLTLIDHFTVAADAPQRMALDLRRQIMPALALYDWHVCFLIGGTVYHGWHGFDPGPGAMLHLHCVIAMAQINAHDSDPFLCPHAEIQSAKDGQGEFAMHCDDGGCRHFADAASYRQWRAFNPLPEAEQQAMALAVLRYGLTHHTYVAANAGDFELYLRIDGKDPPPAFLAALKDSGWRLHPASAYAGKGMQVTIPAFVADAADHAGGGLRAYCGQLCAVGETYHLRKVKGAWQVEDYKLDWIS